MPVGVIADAVCVFLGGMAGSFLGNGMSERIKTNLNMIFGLSAAAIGIFSLTQMKNTPVVILALIIGTLIGLLINISDGVRSGVRKVTKGSCSEDLITIIVLFCVSATGYYGALTEGMGAGSSILFTKAILDFFTGMIIACSQGKIVAFLCIPQFVIHLVLFLLATLIYPLCTPSMIGDFSACGGIIMIATGCRMLNLKMFPTADMIPAMIIVMPLSWLWTSFIAPLL